MSDTFSQFRPTLEAQNNRGIHNFDEVGGVGGEHGGQRGSQRILESVRQLGSPERSPGILPVAKSSFGVLGLDWRLPGHGEAYADCGSKRFRACLNVEEHDQEGLFEEIVGKAYLEIYRRSCGRPECPVCYEKWAGKEAKKIEHRLKAVGKSMGLVIHVTVSPSEEDVTRLPFEKLRAKSYSIVQKNGFLGGSCIYHPFREDDFGLWYFSPHFHMIGFGWIHGTREGYEEHGWIVKNIGVRESVSGTALYQLSHCGIHERLHSVTWFGRLSYNKLKVAPDLQEKHLCPICHAELVAVFYVGPPEALQDLEEEGPPGAWVDPEFLIRRPRG